MYIQEPIKYLTKFIESHIAEYRMAMIDYKHTNYGTFPHYEKIEGCMAEMVHHLDETFGNITIPEWYVTPISLIQAAENFVGFLDAYQQYFTDARNNILDKDTIPESLLKIDQYRHATIDAFSHFILISKEELSGNATLPKSEIEKVLHTMNGFGNVARQLTKRRKDSWFDRKTLEINDEYDVQDLLHSLLTLDFQDIRSEEWNPSLGGKSTRSDFLLKDEKIIIETKKTRKNLKDKELSEELIIDTAHYKENQNCKMLICFIYDPDKFITNPKWLINDLEKWSVDGFDVKVVISN